jgi:serine/threonine protein phosphatase PrpC
MDSGLSPKMASAPWRIVRASVIGSSHIKAGVPCQDFSLHELIDLSASESVLVTVISDGAGSAEQAAAGSFTACHAFVALVRLFIANGGTVSSLERTQAESWVKQIADQLERTASDTGHNVRDYACTLLAAIIGNDAAAFIQIGDGAIVISHGEEDGWSWVFWPQHGEFANTTNFVVSENALQVLEFELAPRPIDELALFTDGIENLVLHQSSKTVHDPFFNALLKPIRQSTASGHDANLSEKLNVYLASAAFCERTDDDKTLLIASRRSETAGEMA